MLGLPAGPDAMRCRGAGLPPVCTRPGAGLTLCPVSPLHPPVAAGMPNSKTGKKGNLRLRFDVQFPRAQLSEAERTQLEGLLKDKY